MMKASTANFGDIASLVKLCRELHSASSWKELTFNPVHTKRGLMNVVRTDGMDVLIVRDDEDVIQGLLLATLDQFFICKEMYATDIHFMCRSGGIQLLAEFERWARRHGAKKIIMGIANDDPTGRIHGFYEAVGMRPIGDAWVKDLNELMERVA